MNQEFKATITMLTPIWAAGADCRCQRLHETGIIGSLRWWYEAIVRGLGGYACDPTSDRRCELSGKEKSDEERYQKLCPACWLFGTGGWKRRFRLTADSDSEDTLKLATLSNNNGWWLKKVFEESLCKESKLVFGKVALIFVFPNNQDKEIFLTQLKALLSVMAYCGSIGAKGQYGFGQFSWEDKDGKMDVVNALEQIYTFINTHRFKNEANAPDWYSLEKFWFIELALEKKQFGQFEHARLIDSNRKIVELIDKNIDKMYLPVSFDIRYKFPSGSKVMGLRQRYYSCCLEGSKNKQKAKQKTRKVFGYQNNGNQQQRQGSRVFVSHLYKYRPQDKDYTLRVWGFTDNCVAEVVAEELKKIFSLSEQPEVVFGKRLIDSAQEAKLEGALHEVR